MSKMGLRKYVAFELVVLGTLTILFLFPHRRIGVGIGYSAHGWRSALERIANWHVIIAFLVYFPWALVQQTLFQFYLLGRLRTLLPAWSAVVATGLSYALVHLPEVWVTLGTAAAGIFWASLYLQYRVLTPLALSHAVLGSTFYSWVYGRELSLG